MSTAPGNYDNLDQLTAASEPAPAPALADGLPPGPPSPAQDFTFVAEGRPGVSMPGFLITPDDSIELRVWNSNAALTSVTMQLRVLKPDGTIVIEAYTLQGLTADRTQNTLAVNQLSGYLVGAVVGPPGVALQRGQTFVNVAVVRGTIQNPLMVEVLIADYMTSSFQPGWPYGRQLSAVDGSGFATTRLGTAVPPGYESALIQPANTRWAMQSVVVTLTTSAAAGNRSVTLSCINSIGAVFVVTAPTTQGPSTQIEYTFGAGVPLISTGPLSQYIPIPQGLVLSQIAQFHTATASLQTGDQYHQMAATVEEWIDV